MMPATFPPEAKAVALRGASLPALIDRELRRKRRRRWSWVAVAVVVVASIVAGVLVARPRPAPLSARFRTAPVTQGELVREVRATGHLDAVSTVSVGAEVSGRIASVEVDFNQKVKAGGVLARFDLAALEAQRAQSAAMVLSAKAQLAQAKFDLEQARRNKARADALFEQQAQALTEHEAAVTALAVAEARVSASEASLAAQTALATVSRTNLEHAVIRSPIDGVIITRNVDPGQTVASVFTTPVLFTVAADLRKMEVLASVDEADIAEVVVGQPVQFTVTAWPGRVFEGKVSEVRNAAHVVQDVVSYGVVVEVDNLDLALRPGMTASVRVRTGTAPDTVQVPNAALSFTPPGEPRSERARVWLLDNGELRSRLVTPGLTDGERTAIGAEEVRPGAQVLIDLTPEGKKAYGLGAP